MRPSWAAARPARSRHWRLGSDRRPQKPSCSDSVTERVGIVPGRRASGRAPVEEPAAPEPDQQDYRAHQDAADPVDEKRPQRLDMPHKDAEILSKEAGQ